MALSRAIRLELADRDISVHAFAQMADINRETMQNLVKGRTTWKSTSMYAVAQALGWSVHDLLDRADPTGELTDFRPEAVARRQGKVVAFPVPAPDEELRDAAFTPRPEDDGEGEGLEFP